MQFVDEIDVGGVCIFILIAHNEVHLLQLVEEPNTFHCDMTAPTLLQDIVHQNKFLRPEAAQYISWIFLDVFVKRLDYMSLCGFACETHAHHSKAILKVLDCIDIQDIRKWGG